MINIGKILNIDIFFSFPPLQSLTHILNICKFMDIMFGCIFYYSIGICCIFKEI